MESQFGSSDTSIYAYQSLDVIPLEYHSKNGSVQSKSSLNTFSTCEKLDDVEDDEDKGVDRRLSWHWGMISCESNVIGRI